MSTSAPSPTALRVSTLSQVAPTSFALKPDADQLADIAAQLDLLKLSKLVFQGQVSPVGKDAWWLQAKLGATIVQSCVVTLDPVTTRIDAPIERRFERDAPDPEEEEYELPADDLPDRLGAWIDPYDVMIEALALHVPEYPRKADASLEAAQFTQAGIKPMTDEDARPFAGLAALKAELSQKDGD